MAHAFVDMIVLRPSAGIDPWADFPPNSDPSPPSPDVEIMNDSFSVPLSPLSRSPSTSNTTINTSINELCDGNLEVLIGKRGGTQLGLNGHLYTRESKTKRQGSLSISGGVY